MDFGIGKYFRFRNDESSKVNLILYKLEIFRINYNSNFSYKIWIVYHTPPMIRTHFVFLGLSNIISSFNNRLCISTSQITLWCQFVAVPYSWSKECCEMMIFTSKWYWTKPIPCISYTFPTVCRIFTYFNGWRLYMMCLSYLIFIQRWEVIYSSTATISFSNHNLRCTQVYGTLTWVSTPNQVSLFKVSFTTFSQCFEIGEAVDIAIEWHLGQY